MFGFELALGSEKEAEEEAGGWAELVAAAAVGGSEDCDA